MTEPLRILAIAPTSFFADYGCHVRIRGQLAALRERGHRVLLVTYPGGRDVDGIETVRAPWPGGAAIQVGSSRRKLALDAVLGPTALAAARRFRPDVLHAYLHEGALIGTMLRAWTGAPLVFDFQGSLTGEMLDHGFVATASAALAVWRRLEAWIDRRPDAVLASSHYAASLLVEARRACAALVVGVPDSVDPAHFRPAEGFGGGELASLRARLSIPPDAEVVGYLGLLAPYQGTSLLLQAFAALRRRRARAHLLLMGFPFVERYRAEAAALGIEGAVTLTGPVPYEDAPAHLALSTVAAAPKLSATEGSGKLLTYMAAGLPVAAFDTPVHREYLGELGRYAPPGDAQALAGALEWLLADPVPAATRGRALRDKAAAAYTWDQAAATIENAYERVLRLPT